DVLKLLDLKMNTPEITEGKRFDRINDYIDNNIVQIEEMIKDLPDKHEQSWEALNKIFIGLLTEDPPMGFYESD
ncbi:MAG: DNA polymerase beta superfamily protein, partial [Candidatus Scatosoma sp.]